MAEKRRALPAKPGYIEPMTFSFDDVSRRAREFLNSPVSSKEGALSVREEAVDLVRTVAIAVGVALLLRIVFFQPFNIPSGSMKPTLLVGDFLFVSKYSYGYSKASLVWPLTRIPAEGRLFGSEPERGDVAVFKNPQNGYRAYVAATAVGASEAEIDARVAQHRYYNRDYIKRVIGLPGDTISVRGGLLHINGEPVDKEFIGERRIDCGSSGRPDFRMTPVYRETLPNSVSYTVTECKGDLGKYDDFGPTTVRAGHLFMMGDNRDGSEDSRGEVGQVPQTNLVGKAEVIFFSADGQKAQFWQIWRWPFGVRYGRIGSWVK